MRKLQSVFILLLMSAVFFGGPARAGPEDYVVGAEQFIRDLADEAITTLTQDSLSREERQELFRDMLSDGFAIPGIARFVMGRYWREATPEEREEYFSLFEESIISLWANRFVDYSGQTFRITEAIPARSARADERAVLVRSLFWSKPSDPVRLDWRVANKGDVYKITDVLVAGVSMANTFRDDFSSVMRRDGVEGLLAMLRSRSNSVRTN